MKMKIFYVLFNNFLCIGIDIGIGRLCNCHIGIGIGIGRYEKMLIGRPLAPEHIFYSQFMYYFECLESNGIERFNGKITGNLI